MASTTMRVAARPSGEARIPRGAGLTSPVLDVEDLGALVGAAGRADAVRELALAALRARGEGHGREGVVGAALVAALLGVASLGIRHGESPRLSAGRLRTSLRPGRAFSSRDRAARAACSRAPGPRRGSRSRPR